MTTKPTQRQQLEQLAQEIKATIPDAWLFPTGDWFKDTLPGNRVQGFLGTGPIMFVAERPSLSAFRRQADHLLYSLLEKFDAADAHLTDVIKSRGRAGEPDPPDMGSHRRVFNREIEIVGPQKIIALGQKAYDRLQFSPSNSCGLGSRRG